MFTANALIQVAVYLSVLLILAKPLGAYIARVYEGKRCGLDFLLRYPENFFYRVARVNSKEEMNWKTYALSVLLFSLIGILFVYLLQRLQQVLPLNPQALAAVKPGLAFNTAVSFVTNTNWQAYAGESTLSYLTQFLGLSVQNFVSAATGMSVLIAVIRGIARKEAKAIGNFWVDLVRGTLYILLPLAMCLALLLVSQGVIQNFKPYQQVRLLHGGEPTVQMQTLPMGPAASQIAIKQLGTNGGGFFNANSAHPFENPTPISNFLEMLSLLLIPAALCFTFGSMVKDKRQGWTVLLIMTTIFVPLLLFTLHAEFSGNPLFKSLALDPSLIGNMEGKEIRFGITNSALWASATTAASNGSVNAMLDSFVPLGGLIPMWLMQLGEVIYGGVGSGLYGMLIFIIITVFITGLMVGRTPEYLGKKVEIFEMRMASLVVLTPLILILICTAIAVATEYGRSSILNPGAHGFSEILYAFTSTANNNGSAFAGLKADTPFFNTVCGLVMLFGRFWIVIPVLAIAGSLARKKIVPVSQGTMPTHTPLFVGLVICVIVVVGALTFFPALALGPIVEQLILYP